MKIRTTLFSIILFAIPALNMKAESNIRDTVYTNIRDYKEELGYFQIANRDLGDPRFMFSTPKEVIEFGIGGTVTAKACYGFCGNLPKITFKPSMAAIPYEPEPLFATTLSNSELHVKARSSWKEHKMIAFLKVGADDGNKIEIKEAYISWDGISAGKIPSFFMDREVGPMTTGICVSNRVDKAHMLFGYTRPIGKHWQVAVSAEEPDFKVLYPQYMGEFKKPLYDDYQPIPDFALHGKYRWSGGHVQGGFIIRKLNAWSQLNTSYLDSEGINVNDMGYGFSLSGNILPSRKLKLSWQAIGGKGIGSYLNVFESNEMDMGTFKREDGYYGMKSIPVVSGFVGAQYDWSEQFSSSIVLGATHTFRQDKVYHCNISRTMLDGAVNFFWNLSDYAYAGIEYMFVWRSVYDFSDLAPDMYPKFKNLHTSANRIALVVAYLF